MARADIRILIVDDEAEIQNLISQVLQSAGFSTQVVGTAAQARAAAADCDYHLLLVDLALPDESGIQLVKDLCKGEGTPAAIVITGHPSVDSVTEAMQMRSRNYLIKPILPEKLVKAVEEVLSNEGVLIESEEAFLAELGKRLRSARQQADLTMKTLGDRIGISQAQISQIEAGLSAPSLTTLYRMTKAVRVPMSDMLAGL